MTHHLPVEAVSSLILRVDDILSENPPAPGAESHLVTLLHGKGMTLLLAQIIGSLKPHIHTTHEETIYVLRGSGQALVGGEVGGFVAGNGPAFPGSSGSLRQGGGGKSACFPLPFRSRNEGNGPDFCGECLKISNPLPWKLVSGCSLKLPLPYAGEGWGEGEDRRNNIGKDRFYRAGGHGKTHGQESSQGRLSPGCL